MSSAAIVFPAPGSPDIKRWWDPAAAISDTRQSSGCPAGRFMVVGA
jgi:hypothetical protein